MLTKHHVVTIAHPRRAPALDPEDVATAARFVRAGESFKTNDESFCPTCLAGKNPGAWCYLYVAWIGSDTTTPNGGAENEGDSHAATTRPNDDDASGERGRARGGGGGEGDDVETAGVRADGAAAEARRRDSLSTCVVFLCSRPDAFEDARRARAIVEGRLRRLGTLEKIEARIRPERRGGRAGETRPADADDAEGGREPERELGGGEAGANSGDPKPPNSPPGTNALSPSRRLASPPPSPPPRGPEEDPGSDHPDLGAGSLGGGPVFSTSPNNVSRSSLGGAFLPSSALRKKPPGVGETRPGSVSLARHVPRAAGGGGGYSTPPGRSGPSRPRQHRALLHFLYVRPPLGQFVAPDWAPPLNDTKAQKTLLRAYQRVLVGARGAEWFARRAEEEDVGFKGANAGGGRSRRAAPGGGANTGARIRGDGGGGGSPFGGATSYGDLGSSGGSGVPFGASGGRKVHFERSEDFVLLACAGTDFELVVALDPTTEQSAAVAVCNRLCAWLRQEEPQLFVPV